MFSSDLDVLARLGFPQTAERIKEAVTYSGNGDNIIEWGFDHDYMVAKHADNPHLTMEENISSRWSVVRLDMPYKAHDQSTQWWGPTAKAAITNAYNALSVSIANHESFKDLDIDTPLWIKS